eukprot:1028810_1
MSKKRILKEIAKFKTDCPDDITIRHNNDISTHFEFDIVLSGRTHSPYENGRFRLLMALPIDYPWKPPLIKFITKVYHPHVHPSGKIGLDILKDHWSPALTMIKVCQSIQSLLHDSLLQVHEAMNKETLTLSKAAIIKKATQWTQQYAIDHGSKVDPPTMDAIDVIQTIMCEMCNYPLCIQANPPQQQQFESIVCTSIRMDAIQCSDCDQWFPNLSLENIETNSFQHWLRNIMNLLQSYKGIEMPYDIVVIIVRYLLEMLVNKQVYAMYLDDKCSEFYKTKEYVTLPVGIEAINFDYITQNKWLVQIKASNCRCIPSFETTFWVDLLNTTNNVYCNSKMQKVEGHGCVLSTIEYTSGLAKYNLDNTYHGTSQVYIKTLYGKTIVLSVDPSKHTVLDLKIQIYQKEGIPIYQQRLIHAGKQMENQKLCNQYNLRRSGTIHLVLRL